MDSGKRKYTSWIIKPTLTDEQVLEIREIYKMADKIRRQQKKKIVRRGLSAELARKYGTTLRVIQHIRTGDRWTRIIKRRRV